MSRTAVRIVLGVVSLALIVAGIQYQRTAALRHRALEAAQRGAAWVSALQIPLKDPGILWILSVVDGAYCHEPRVAQYVAEHFAEFEGRGHPIYPALKALALGEKDQNFEAFSQRWQRVGDKSGIASAMAWAVYCDRVPMPEAVGRTVFGTSATGYQLTHQYLALRYMEGNGCLAAPDRKALDRALDAIAEEQRHDAGFSDLWAERLALLLYGDPGHVERAWIEKLLEKQEPSGAWSDPNFPQRFYQMPENPHTTVLAVWALAQYGRGCPF